MYLFEFDNFELLKIKNAISNYGHEFISFPTNIKDPLLIRRREEIRNKNNYYDDIEERRNESRKKINNLFKEKGMNQFVLSEEITVDIEKERNKGMQATYIGFR